MYDIVQRKVIVSHKNNIPLFDRCDVRYCTGKVIVSHKNNIPLFDRCDVRYCTRKVIVSHKNNIHYLIDVMYDIVQEK